MQDVRTWFLVLELASFVWVIPQDVYPGRRTSVIILLLTLGFVTITLLRFDTVWNYMHHVLFRNQLWILPIDSYLIEHFFDTFLPAVVSGFGIWILLWLKTLLPILAIVECNHHAGAGVRKLKKQFASRFMISLLLC